jgi:hypothetical protein
MRATEVREEETLKLSGRVPPPRDGAGHELLPFRLAPDADPL